MTFALAGRDYHRKEEDKRKKQMQVYCSSFEQPMLEDAKKYYQRESQTCLGGANSRETMSFVDYMQHVDKRFAVCNALKVRESNVVAVAGGRGSSGTLYA